MLNMPLVSALSPHQRWSKPKIIDEKSNALRLIQGEIAVLPVKPATQPVSNETIETARNESDPFPAPRYVGSTDATTCVVIVVRAEKLVVVAHVDSGSMGRAVVEHVADLTASRRSFDMVNLPMARVWMAGSFRDEHGMSEPIVGQTIAAMRDSTTVQFVLEATCVLDENTDVRTKAPIFTGLAYDMLLGVAIPVKFEGEFPGMLRRYSLGWLGGREIPRLFDYAQVWDPVGRGTLLLRGFRCDFSDEFSKFLRKLLLLGDAEFLELSSTSPKYEEPEYCAIHRETFLWLLQNRGSVIPEERYEWEESTKQWELVVQRTLVQ